MAKNGFKFDLRGVREVQNKLGKMSADMDQGVNDLVKAAAWDMNDDAISNIQSEGAIDLGAGGGLLSGQSVRQAGTRTFEVLNSSKHAPFIEWGTGRQVQVNNEWSAYARQFKGPYPGTWDEFEQNIKAWMHRHNIPEKLTYVIMHRILEDGLRARPFLYPAYVKNKIQLIKDIKKLFK